MSESIEALNAEIPRLTALLEQHNIDWRLPVTPERANLTAGSSTTMTPEKKIALFRSLFSGRCDVYPIRWENKRGDRTGYSPACANEWRPGVCEKPKIKCSNCQHRALMPLTDQAIFDHLAGVHTLGVYPLLSSNLCHFLAVDFDKASWRSDVQAFADTCHQLAVPVSIEISRSGNGAHAWVFFDGAVQARDARQLGTALISHTCAKTQQLDLGSYDRLFPNQDTMPKGGFGNLIALPLQKAARQQNYSVFVDSDLQSYEDQWDYLAQVVLMSRDAIEATVLLAAGKSHPLDVAFIDEEDQKTPWNRSIGLPDLDFGNLPKVIQITLSDKVYIEKEGLPQSMLNRIIRLAAFQNPEFYNAQAMRFSVWDKPRVIGCAENFPFHIALPRGCLEPLEQLLNELQITIDFQDKRETGQPVQASFTGSLTKDQQFAVETMLSHHTGILCAPTAFGKTVVGAAMIARRAVNTLILVHRSELQTQWKERLQSFLEIENDAIGFLGSGKKQLTGKIDIALVQSLCRKNNVSPAVEQYGQIIVDECHHVSAHNFESVLKSVKAKFILGLTATPVRRDGQQPIVFMQCGPIRHTAKRSVENPLTMRVVPHHWQSTKELNEDAPIQDAFRHLAEDSKRTKYIADLATSAFQAGRNILLLTERTEHLMSLAAAIPEEYSPFILHGKIPKKQRAATLQQLQSLPPDKPSMLLATGNLIGEGFNHAVPDTRILAMPVFWKGTVQQYVGRLHRYSEGKTCIEVVDMVDAGHPAFTKMWERRQKG